MRIVCKDAIDVRLLEYDGFQRQLQSEVPRQCRSCLPIMNDIPMSVLSMKCNDRLPIKFSEDTGLTRDQRLFSMLPWQLEKSLEYTLPTSAINSSVNKGTELPYNNSGEFDCPSTRTSHTISVPGVIRSIREPNHGVAIEEPKQDMIIGKLARNILKIRRRKMNRHKLKKLRKRMKFVYRKQLRAKKKKKEMKFQEEMRAIMKRAEDFDAEAFVARELERAKKGGFRVDIFSSPLKR